MRRRYSNNAHLVVEYIYYLYFINYFTYYIIFLIQELSKDILKETDDDTNVDILEDEFIVTLNDDITVIAENEDTKGAEEISSPLHPITSTMDESFPDIANNIGAVFQSLSTVDAFNITDMVSDRIFGLCINLKFILST